MNVYIQLTSAGTATGNFDLYSDVDGYITAFETNISRNKLLNGYTSTLVPSGTTIIQVVSGGSCNVSVYITIVPIPPTTTSTTSTTTSTTSTSTTSTTSTTTSTSSTTSTTTTGTSSTTTTTTTTFPVQQILVSRSLTGNTQPDAESVCGNEYTDGVDIYSTQVLYFKSLSTIPSIGQTLYTDINCAFIASMSDGTWWAAVTNWGAATQYDYSIQISSYPGTVSDITACPITTTTTTSSSTTTTSTTSVGTTTTTTTTLSYHVEMSVNNTTYDFINEVNIPYSLSPTLISTPTKAGYNYLFLSIPTDKTFTLVDSLGTDISGTFSIDVASGSGGEDIRSGYHTNYIYKSADVYATDYSTDYTLTLS